MTSQLEKHTLFTLHEIIEAVRSLSPDDQARLRDELSSLVRVYIESPDTTQAANQRGQELADQLRSELQSTSMGQLDQVMSLLRGRKWSS